MIPLVLAAEVRGVDAPFVVRLTATTETPDDALLRRTEQSTLVISHGRARARIAGSDPAPFLGDIVLLDPARSTMQRLIRAGSRHNTFLVTERCDQLCVMCSQPPKKTHHDNFVHYERAALLAPQDAVLGFSGGEPTLYKRELFALLERVHAVRPDLRFHVLTNAQHFSKDDISFFSSSAGRTVQWGVPLYAADADLHDQIVGKDGAFKALLGGLAFLCQAAANVELRTVLTTMNAPVLPRLSYFITRLVPFAAPWAIMQLERIGYASNRWNELFFDSSANFEPIARAIDIARLSEIPTLLYNFPLCTVPSAYRVLAPATISDWKNKFLEDCKTCSLRSSCGGFFAWHTDQAYSRLEPQ